MQKINLSYVHVFFISQLAGRGRSKTPLETCPTLKAVTFKFFDLVVKMIYFESRLKVGYKFQNVISAV